MIDRLAHSAMHRVVSSVRKPKYRRIVNQAVAVFRPRAPKAGTDNLRLTNDLERDGFVSLGQPFPSSLLAGLKGALLERPCYDSWRPELGRFKLQEVPLGTNTAHICSVSEIPEAQAIVEWPQAVSIASQYLGCRPVVENVLAWWSLAGRDGPVEEQYYHRDNNSSRFIKFFVYLTDVGENNGPHMFIRGSHASEECLTASKRWTDKEVYDKCGTERIMRFTGPFGAAFLEDTYGIHKGELPREGERLIFQVTYSTYRSPPPIRGSQKAGDPPEELG